MPKTGASNLVCKGGVVKADFPELAFDLRTDGWGALACRRGGS